MRSVIGLCTVALVCSAATPAVADSGSTAPARLTARVSSAKANATMAFLLPLRVDNPRIGTTLGFDVVDAGTGEPIYSRMADAPLRPASNMKIVTALTALRVLGPDSRMTTDAVVPQRGQVILRGGGDTTLGAAGLTRLASATAKYLTTNDLLPTAPKGRPPVQVFVDDSRYGKPKRGPGWTGSYQPSIARPVRPLGRLGVYQWDSASEAGAVFAAALRSQGVKARLVGHRDAAPDSQPAAQVTGDTVATQVRYMLQVSENNIAEMLYRQV
ncbi:MAG TPA: D-alanyl-D-alanine carboxypeptidase, partial [Actinomycetota bacterium]|nr:D-alanyl-D-alanine carboxypeptidase [Actinomycetota bacterium]